MANMNDLTSSSQAATVSRALADQANVDGRALHDTALGEVIAATSANRPEQWSVIAAAAGLFAWAVFGNSTARRVTVRLFSYGLILLPLIAVVCLAAVVEFINGGIVARFFKIEEDAS
jgi:CHASE2 domain-containing sensor protein